MSSLKKLNINQLALSYFNIQTQDIIQSVDYAKKDTIKTPDLNQLALEQTWSIKGQLPD